MPEPSRIIRIVIMVATLLVALLLQPHDHHHESHHKEVSSMPQIHTFQLGLFRCHVINDGDTAYATAEFLFHNAPSNDLNEHLRSYDLDPESTLCANNCLLVHTGKELILIDTGCGTSQSRAGMEKTGNLLAGLERLFAMR